MIEHLIKAATCRITCDTESGTGWLIAKDLVITARHCVFPGIDDGKSVELFFPDSGDTAISAKIVAQSEDWDACLLSLEVTLTLEPLPISLELPREGEAWQAFGYPGSKSDVGHRLTGTVAQTMDTPKRQVDLDLSINQTTVLEAYKGMSGGAMICESLAVGIVSKKLDGTVAATSLHQLESFLSENGVVFPDNSAAPSAPLLADRGDFPEDFTEEVKARPGSYLFLEGAHGYGKSTFCENFRADDKTLINVGAYCITDPNSVLGADYRAQPEVFFEWFATAISRIITGKPLRKEKRNYSELIKNTSQYLNDLSKYCVQRGRQGILFLDGLNEIPEGTLLSELLGLLPATLPPQITVVLTAPNFGNIEGKLAGKVKITDVLELPALPNSACYRYCQKALNPERRSPSLIDRICDKAKGHPLYLRYMIEYANHQAIDDDLEDFPVLTGPIEDYYQGIWTKLLPDHGAVNLLALMARLREGIPIKDFSKALDSAEQKQFISVMNRIRHLLTDAESTNIYHTSFEAYIIEKTTNIDEPTYRRLADFCLNVPDVRYCTLNRIFHLCRASDATAFSECTQTWFDSAVTLGIEPDTLIADVDEIVKRAAMEAAPDEFFRLTLLSQRISFRYDTLFAQSAKLIAEALIVLGRPSEALQHVMRLKTLIVGPDDVLQISFLLHQHGYDDEALTLLDLLQERIIESYSQSIEFMDFIELCTLHIRTVFIIRLANGWSGTEQISKILTFAKRACDEASKENNISLDDAMITLIAESPTYFLTFRDHYADLNGLKAYQLNEGLPEAQLPPRHLETQCIALLNFDHAVDSYHLTKNRKALSRIFSDLDEMILTSDIDEPIANTVSDTLIRFGAPSKTIEAFAAKGGEKSLLPLQIKAPNEVDVNQKGLRECLYGWRTAAFLDSNFCGPSGGIIASTNWLETIEHLVGMLYCIDGKSRRAKSDSNEASRVTCCKQLKKHVIEPLRFTLKQRADWKDSYFIPENSLPDVYRQLAELLNDCFPEETLEWLDDLVKNADGQWGLYSEGFLTAVFYVLRELTREQPSTEVASRLLALAHAWRDHTLRGVQNRHELVPEILRMIPVFTALGANEEAERLYEKLLSVSMGPTWYKEDQLGIMTEALGSVDISQEIGQRLPKVAAYLEKASSEMTFQRYVRAEKFSLIGQIARQGKYRAALAYFRRQCCGSMAELWAEAQQGPIDNLGPLKGNRFPGGALDDQAAILALVSNSETVTWSLRWALLEIFNCGDRRHLTDYAEAFAKIASEVGANLELIKRAEIVANAETPSDERSSFASAFQRELKPELHADFAAVLLDLPPLKPAEAISPRRQRDKEEEDDDNIIYHPGVFGHNRALREAGQILDDAEQQWALGNHNAARAKAVEVLQTIQEGDWGIWGNSTDEARRAEDILMREEKNAANVIRNYTTLIEAERHVAKWIPAQHLIGKVGSLLNDQDSQKLLDVVIDHIRLVVGDAAQEIQDFGFLADDTAELSPDVEFFRFIVWLCDHPQWLRRERSSAMLLWLVEQIPEMFSEAAAIAFSMDEGYGPDLLCGVFDGASVRDPVGLWDKLSSVIDLTNITQELQHVSRMSVLERLARRAAKAGSSSAKSALNLIKASFMGTSSNDSNLQLPAWAAALEPEFSELKDLFNSDAVTAWGKELEKLCSPVSIQDAQDLENSVLESFCENHRPLDRWESKLRHSLNLALWPHVSSLGARKVENSLRCYNPSHPEQSVLAISDPLTDQLREAIRSSDYSTVFGSSETVLLSHHDMAVNSTEDGIDHIEVICLLKPTSNQFDHFFRPPEQSFYSSDLPLSSTVNTPFETCCHLKPEVVYFGTYTPATPLDFFQNLVSAKDEDFVRKNWRYGRRNDVTALGMPVKCGCSLSLPRSALTIPPAFKLTWCIMCNGHFVALIDEHNNQLM